MRSQPSVSEKKEWRNQTMCIFQKFEQSITKRQLSSSEDGSYFTEGCGISKNVNDGWFLWLHSYLGPPI